MKTSRQVTSVSSVVEDWRHEAGDVAMNLLSSATRRKGIISCSANTTSLDQKGTIFNITITSSNRKFVAYELAVTVKDQDVNLLKVKSLSGRSAGDLTLRVSTSFFICNFPSLPLAIIMASQNASGKPASKTLVVR